MTTYNPPPAVTSNVFTISQGQGKNAARPISSKYLTKIKRTAILQLTGACVLTLLGIVVISIRAFWSNYATAIWSGLVIFGMTGMFGTIAACKRNQHLVRTYLSLSIVGAAMGMALFGMHLVAMQKEPRDLYYNGHYYYGICMPSGWSTHHWEYCDFAPATRKAFNGMIMANGLFLSVVCIVSAWIGCCASCPSCERCCKTCCDDCGQCCRQYCAEVPPAPATIQRQDGQCANVFTTGQQAGMFIVQQGPSPAPASTNQGPATCVLMPAANQMPEGNQVALRAQPPIPDMTMQPQPALVPVDPPGYHYENVQYVNTMVQDLDQMLGGNQDALRAQPPIPDMTMQPQPASDPVDPPGYHCEDAQEVNTTMQAAN